MVGVSFGRGARTVVLLLASLLVLPGLGVGAAQEEREVSFGFWGDPAELAAYQGLAAAYEEANPGRRVRIQHVPGQDDFYARLATGFAAGNPPEVFLVNYRRYGQFAARGALLPVEAGLAEREIDLGAYYPEPLAAFSRGDELICLPQNLSSLVVYVNRDRFVAKGVPLPEPGWTWDEFLAAAKALTEDVDGDGLVDYYGVGLDNTLVRFSAFIWQAGGEVVDDPNNPTRLTIDSPEARAAIQWVIDLSLVHQVVPTEPEVLALTDEDRFMAGTTAMLFQSRRAVPTLREIEDFAWDVAPLPVGEDAAGILHSDAYCVAATTADPEAALDFVAWAAGPTGQPIAAASGRTVPSLVAVAESAAFLGPSGGVASGTPLDRFSPPANSRVYLDTISDIRRLPSTSTWPEVEEAFDTTVGRAFYGELSIDDAILLAQERAADAFRRAAEDAGS